MNRKSRLAEQFLSYRNVSVVRATATCFRALHHIPIILSDDMGLMVGNANALIYQRQPREFYADA